MKIQSQIDGRDVTSRPFIVIFTNTFPYETGETFLETELPYLLSLKRPLVLVPLYGQGLARPVPSTLEAPVIIAPPLLPFPPKNRSKLLFYGLCNFAPVFFAMNDFFTLKVWRSRFRIWRFATSWLLIRAILSRNKRLAHLQHPEQVTFYFYWGDKSVLLLPFLRHKGKTVVRFHGSDLYEEAHGFHPFRKLVLPFIDLACPISQHGADYLLLRYGALAPPISVARLGSIDHGLGPAPQSGTPFHIVTCARLVSIKRLHLIWKALKLLYRTTPLPPLRWTIIGDGPVRPQLQASIASITLSDNLSIELTGEMSHDEVMKFYRQTPVDLFMLTSKSEGVPVSIMEALSFGIPVMATAVGGVPELVSDDVGCLLPANPTVEEVKQRLLDFIDLPMCAREMKRRQARAVWETGWNGAVNFRKFALEISKISSRDAMYRVST